jgi:ArsR family transcriptional regulator, arsenate/arsenite/antimonite-responsive transcriptional repressor
MADLFDVLADGTRRELLATLLQRRIHGAPEGELSVGELVERLGLSQPTVSKHLQKLREHGLVSVRTEGQHHLYRLESEPLHEIERWIGDFVGEHSVADAPHADGPIGSAAFAAWSGAEVGESLGRRLADGTYQARVAAASATGKVAARLPRIGRRKADDKV